MNSKFLKIIFAVVLSVFMFSKANAALLLVADSNNVEWELVGSFFLSDGDFWDDINDCDALTDPIGCDYVNAKPLNGLEAAQRIFGNLNTGVYATSTNALFVNNKAWYDAVGGAVTALDEGLVADFNSDGFYSMSGDFSAYVQDSFRQGTNPLKTETFVFRTPSAPVGVAAPPMLALALLAIFALGAQRKKRCSF